MRIPALAVIAALALTAGCKPPLIPGTRIVDSKDTRAALDVLARYKTAFEALDAQALLDLTAPTYFDKGDASKGAPPRDYAALKEGLPEDFKKLKGVKIEATIKDVRVEGDQAFIEYYVVMHYLLTIPSTTKYPWKDDQDDARLTLVRVGGAWKIQSGL